MADLPLLYLLGFGLVFAGIIILIAATLLVSACADMAKMAAGVIVVGPVPIVFGSDMKTVNTILKLAVAFTAILIVLTLIYYFLPR
jgi:uncharacterized membrane protein